MSSLMYLKYKLGKEFQLPPEKWIAEVIQDIWLH